jgi:hypothetical protein
MPRPLYPREGHPVPIALPPPPPPPNGIQSPDRPTQRAVAMPTALIRPSSNIRVHNDRIERKRVV